MATQYLTQDSCWVELLTGVFQPLRSASLRQLSYTMPMLMLIGYSTSNQSVASRSLCVQSHGTICPSAAVPRVLPAAGSRRGPCYSRYLIFRSLCLPLFTTILTFPIHYIICLIMLQRVDLITVAHWAQGVSTLIPVFPAVAAVSHVHLFRSHLLVVFHYGTYLFQSFQLSGSASMASSQISC